jgi:hypothetical protein
MCRKLILLVSFVPALVLCGSIAIGQENQVVNGEFDDALNSWNSYGAAGFTFEVVQDAGLSGNNAVMIDVTNASAAASIGINQMGLGLELVQGETYPIGFTAKAEQEREMIMLFQIYKPEIPQWMTPMEVTVQLTTDPQTFTFEYLHESESTTDHPNWSVNFYLILKSQWLSMNGDGLNIKVWMDRVYFGAEFPPQHRDLAVDPTPADGALYEDTWANLSWSPGDFAVSHDVYFGDNFDDVNAGAESTFQGNQASTFYVAGFPGFAYPDGLVPGTTYYWRIDEVNDTEPNSPWKGKVWSFSIPPKTAYDPVPAEGVKFIDPSVELSWTRGFRVKLHTVYFGDNFDDVNNAAGGLTQGTTIYTPGPLELGKTYYWRVDEFDAITTHTGDVWSFTTAGAGGGVRADYYKGMNFESYVLTRIDPQINFNWGSGSPDEAVGEDNFSVRWTGEVEAAFTETYTFYISVDDGVRLWVDGQQLVDNWTAYGPTEKSGKIDLAGGQTYSVLMEMYENGGSAVAELRWSSPRTPKQLIPQAALSLPVRASRSNPSNGSVDVKQIQILSWSPGDYADSHQVYFGTDQDAVKNANTGSPEYKGSRNLGSESYDPGNLEWNTTYYWRVDEVNNANADSPWTGPPWSFTTANFLVVDDFESYNDLDPTDPASNRIFNVWLDGFDNPAINGSVVGHANPPFAEQTIVHSGSQSMPMSYDNAVGKSEATLTLTNTRDWTVNGVNTLTIWSRGSSSNAAETMYVVLNGSAVVTHDNPDAAQKASWTEWNIDLSAPGGFADQGVNLSNVNTITLGLGNRNNPVAGGTGMMYFDDIRLYAPDLETP